jgi:STE24 endopeptidase
LFIIVETRWTVMVDNTVFHALLLLCIGGSQAFFTALAALNLRYGEQAIERNAEWLEQRIGIDDPEDLFAYTAAKTKLSHFQSWTLIIGLIALLYTGGFTTIVETIAGTSFGPVVQGLLFFSGLIVVYQLASAPFGYYSTFVIEERFGFNEQSVGLWLRDQLLQIVLSVVIAGALFAAILAAIEYLPYWWVAGWALLVGFGLLMQILYPRVIAPLFNDFEPIEDGELRTAVEEVFDRAGFECEDLFTMDASRRSSHLNAYFIGFGATKRVVLFDTLVEKLERPEIQSVLAHELAHWKKAHIWKLVGATALRLGVVFALLGFLVDATWIYELFALDGQPKYAGLFLCGVFVLPTMNLLSPLENKLSLRFERQADEFAVETMDDGEPMVEALAGLVRENLGNPFPHPWYAAFHYDHPPIPDRIRYVQEFAEQQDDSTPGSADGVTAD